MLVAKQRGWRPPGSRSPGCRRSVNATASRAARSGRAARRRAAPDWAESRTRAPRASRPESGARALASATRSWLRGVRRLVAAACSGRSRVRLRSSPESSCHRSQPVGGGVVQLQQVGRPSCPAGPGERATSPTAAGALSNGVVGQVVRAASSRQGISRSPRPAEYGAGAGDRSKSGSDDPHRVSPARTSARRPARGTAAPSASPSRAPRGSGPSRALFEHARATIVERSAGSASARHMTASSALISRSRPHPSGNP